MTHDTGPPDRRLLLLRHGKAESPLGVADRERPLAGRGRRQSEYAGAECHRLGLLPDHAVVSPARRAKETADSFRAGLGGALACAVDSRVYDNTVDSLLDIIAEVPDDVSTLLIIGHNPSLAGLAALLDDSATRRAGTALADGFPTGAVAVFSVGVSWPRVGPGSARLSEVIRRPR